VRFEKQCNSLPVGFARHRHLCCCPRSINSGHLKSDSRHRHPKNEIKVKVKVK
jgi:hypothetical protein